MARFGWISHWPLKTSATLSHSVLMTYGFLPLFFLGFIQTAGPRWLGVQPSSVKSLVPVVLLQLIGWLLWLTGSVIGPWLQIVGGWLACSGLCWAYSQFGKLVSRSQASDRTHARALLFGGWVGIVSLAGMLAALQFDQYGLAKAALLTGLWGFIGTTFVSVAHRMIPFFTASAVPMVTVWRPYWILYFMLTALAVSIIPIWTQQLSIQWPLIEIFTNFWLMVSGLVIVWLALIWGLMKALSNKLLIMLHIGFVWLGLSFLLVSVGHFWSWVSGNTYWGLGAIHATTMGFFGSLTMAMVTRVSCGHSGRPLRADALMWWLFVTLEIVIVIRIAADILRSDWSYFLLVAASIGWSAVILTWAIRLLGWYGKPRKDHQPG